MKDENQEIFDSEKLNINAETEDLATKIKIFGAELTDVLRDLPNDEPIKPNHCEFDSFLLHFTEGSIMRKIKEIENTITPKKPTMASRRSY